MAYLKFLTGFPRDDYYQLKNATSKISALRIPLSAKNSKWKRNEKKKKGTTRLGQSARLTWDRLLFVHPVVFAPAGPLI